jgi:ATP-dependent protease ClpP protease subunit
MIKKTGIITASYTGENAVIKIDGFINAELQVAFDKHIAEFINNGVENVTVQINSFGGSVFIANEIANKLKSFKNVTCEIGAICASAATYIALTCSERSMPRNGQFMIHKPMSNFAGNEDEMKADLKLLANITKDYKKHYSKVTGISETEIESMWKTNYWMDAQEALDKGFITSIVEEDVTMDVELVAQITAMGSPIKVPEPKEQIFIDTNMKLPLITAALQLNEDATEAQAAKVISDINAKVSSLEAKNADLETKLKAIETERTAQIEANAVALVEAAIKENKIKATEKDRFLKLAKTDFESVQAILASMSPYKAATSMLASETEKPEPFEGKSYDELTKTAGGPKYLEKLKAENPEKFNALKQEAINKLQK